MTMKNSTAARLRRRGQLAEIGYWGVVVPCLILCWLARETAAFIRDMWPLVLGVVCAGAMLLGFALVMSGATDAAQRMFGAVCIGGGGGILGILIGALAE